MITVFPTPEASGVPARWGRFPCQPTGQGMPFAEEPHASRSARAGPCTPPRLPAGAVSVRGAGRRNAVLRRAVPRAPRSCATLPSCPGRDTLAPGPDVRCSLYPSAQPERCVSTDTLYLPVHLLYLWVQSPGPVLVSGSLMEGRRAGTGARSGSDGAGLSRGSSFGEAGGLAPANERGPGRVPLHATFGVVTARGAFAWGGGRISLWVGGGLSVRVGGAPR